MAYNTKKIYLNTGPKTLKLSRAEKKLVLENFDIMTKEPRLTTLIFKSRKKAKLTQAQIADKLKVTRAFVNHWERGVSAPPNPIIPKLAMLLNIKVDELFRMSHLWRLWKRGKSLQEKIDGMSVAVNAEIVLPDKPKKGKKKK
jgi:DNA-binding transcriptional regulator YiaG